VTFWIVMEAFASAFAVLFGVMAFRDVRRGVPRGIFLRHRNGAWGCAAWAILIAGRLLTHAFS
jgi:hypothetical protein